MKQSLFAYWPVLCASVPGFLLFDPSIALLQGIFMVFLFSWWKDSSSSSPSSSFQWQGPLVWACLGFFVLMRVFPFFSAAHPLGYDTGIYRYEIWALQTGAELLISGVSPAFAALMKGATLTGLDGDQILYGSYALIQLAFFGILYAFVKFRWGARKALFAVFLLAISLVQWKAYSLLLFKQSLACVLLLAAFISFEKRSWWTVLFGVVLALLQALDALFLGLAGGIFLLFHLKDTSWRRYGLTLLLWCAGVGIVLAVLFPEYWAAAWGIFSQALTGHLADAHIQEGAFLQVTDFGYLGALVWSLGFVGVLFSFRQDRISVFHVYGGLLLVWILSQLFFFQRLLIQLDLVLVVFAAYALDRGYRSLFEGSALWVRGVFVLLCATPLMVSVWRYEVPFSASQLDTVTTFCDALPDGVTVVAAESSSAPWLKGWCPRHIVLGPGVFANRWDEDEWRLFWKGGTPEEVAVLLDEYARPLYFYSQQKELQERFFPELFEREQSGWYRVRE